MFQLSSCYKLSFISCNASNSRQCMCCLRADILRKLKTVSVIEFLIWHLNVFASFIRRPRTNSCWTCCELILCGLHKPNESLSAKPSEKNFGLFITRNCRIIFVPSIKQTIASFMFSLSTYLFVSATRHVTWALWMNWVRMTDPGGPLKGGDDRTSEAGNCSYCYKATREA
jgi:hypothetical protein